MSEFRGYQRRAIDQFREQGVEQLDEVHVLELLLFFSSCHTNTFPLSHDLLNHFGTLKKVLAAPIEILEMIPGINTKTAVLINLTGQISRYYLTQHGADPISLRTSKACAEYLTPFFSGQRNEKIYLLCLDAKASVIYCRDIEEGSVCAANVPIRRIVEIVLAVNAITVVLAHNHPGGLPYPSTDDIVTTKRLAIALDTVDVVLADHIIFADSDYISLAESGYYRPDECRLKV